MDMMKSEVARKIDWKFVGWHILYTAVLAWWAGLFLLGPFPQDLGREPGYWTLYFGVIPSALVLALAFLRPTIGYCLVLCYGAFIALATIAIPIIGGNAFGLIVVFPMWPFILEAGFIWGFRAAKR